MIKGIGAIKTLKICRELWRWLAANPSHETTKCDWPGWEKYGRMRNECPCCEFVSDRRSPSPEDPDCALCPLNGYAWPRDYVSCCDFPSPFRRWGGASTNQTRINNALKMVAACDAALKDRRKT